MTACRRVALLEQRMRERVRRIGVFIPQRHGAFGQGPADAGVSCLGMGPAEIGEKPPILAIVRSVALANREFCGIVVRASRERVEAEGAEQQREYQRIARKLVEMLLRAGQGHGRFPLDGCGHDLDVLAFAPARSGGELPGERGLGARLRGLHVHLVDARPRDIGECEVRIFGDGAVESFGGPKPGRKHAVDAVAVKHCRVFRYGRQRQIVSVLVHLAFPAKRGRTVLHHETSSLGRFGR